MDKLRLAPASRARGAIRLPGSKSLTNRALLLSAVAVGETQLDNLLVSDDAEHMKAALQHLGVGLALSDDGRAGLVTGIGGAFHPSSANDINAPLRLYLGNAGTAYRPLTAMLAAGRGHYELAGEPRMAERPIKDLVDAIVPLGANIDYLGAAGYPPLLVHANGLRGGTTSVRGDVSSQFLTALLMAAPYADGPVNIDIDGELVSKPYIRITLATMAAFGIDVTHDADFQHFAIEPGVYRSPGRFLVEGDASSATYFLAAGAIAGGPVRVYGITRDSVQGDSAFAEVLARMGAIVDYGDDWIEVRRGGANRLRAIDADLNDIPDAAMTIAAAALFADGTTHIRNIWNWRVKETDRLDAMARELRKLGATVVETDSSISITPPARIKSAAIDTYNDHRMAMSLALACLGGEAITINDPGCVAKTFPDFFAELASVLD